MENSKSFWLQFSSGQGPEECEWVVGKAVESFCSEARQMGVEVNVLERIPGRSNSLELKSGRSLCFRSVRLDVRGEKATAICRQWQGTIQWIGQSPFRPRHQRKNWFIAVDGLVGFKPLDTTILQKDLRIEIFRASGAGGQHVNKTSSAIRVTHRPTGIVVVSQDGRSQHRNKQIALKRLEMMLALKHQEVEKDMNRKQRDMHNQLIRGNPQRIFVGAAFIPK